jgi:hypothetical protein
MKKSLLIGAIVIVLAMSGIGAAFATGMSFSNVGALSLGWGSVPQINTDYIGFHLVSAASLPVRVDGVYISLDTTIGPDNAVSVSLRNAADTELAWYAANNVSWAEGTTYLVNLTPSDSVLPGPEQVYYVKVTVATQSQYN